MTPRLWTALVVFVGLAALALARFLNAPPDLIHMGGVVLTLVAASMSSMLPGGGATTMLAILVLPSAMLFSTFEEACTQVKSPTPVEIEAGVGVVDNGCSLLEGVTQNATVISICATVEEIASIASYVVSFLRVADAGPPTGPCTPLGNTGVCASKEEIGKGASLVLAKRQAKLRRDAGMSVSP